MYNYRISCDTGFTWQSYDIVFDDQSTVCDNHSTVCDNQSMFHMDGFYIEMSDTASIAT